MRTLAGRRLLHDEPAASDVTSCKYNAPIEYGRRTEWIWSLRGNPRGVRSQFPHFEELDVGCAQA